MENRVLFIIVTYNSQELINKCLDSILKFEKGVDILVVDNNSIDNTKKILNEQYKCVHVIENTLNSGFGSANNLGFKYALENDYDYLYLLNHDAYLVESVVEKLIINLEFLNKSGIISPLHLSQDESLLELKFFNCFDQEFLSKILLYRNFYPLELDFYPAASWFFKSSLLISVGFFDSVFFHYGEDNNYMQRVIFKGFKNYIDPNLKIVHVGNPNKFIELSIYSKFKLQKFLAAQLLKFTDINYNFTCREYVFLNGKIFIKAIMQLVLFQPSNCFRLINLNYELLRRYKLIIYSRKLFNNHL